MIFCLDRINFEWVAVDSFEFDVSIVISCEACAFLTQPTNTSTSINNNNNKTFNLQLVLTTWVRRNGTLKQLLVWSIKYYGPRLQSIWIKRNKMKLVRFHNLPLCRVRTERTVWACILCLAFFFLCYDLPCEQLQFWIDGMPTLFIEEEAKANARLMYDSHFSFSLSFLSIWSNPW